MGTGGWVLTENGRQPWIVQGLMLTAPTVALRVVPVDLKTATYANTMQDQDGPFQLGLIASERNDDGAVPQ